MKTIAYFIPYFGKLPESINMWLLSCKMNPTVDWVLVTDDKTQYDYPDNVKVIYCTYDEIKKKIQDNYDFTVNIYKPWKLCEFKPAYGEIFADLLHEYDFWGQCDMDLIWGDIRKFVTDDMLEKYDKIGFQGHSTLYRNTPENNARYGTEIPGLISYKEAFASDQGHCFDEVTVTEIFDRLGLKQYKETNFAHLNAFSNSFYLGHLDKSEDYKNKRQVIVWKNGKIYRYYNHNGKMYTDDEFMYFHTFMRPIKYKIDRYDENCVYVAYPDIIKRIDEKELTYDFVQKHGTCSMPKFYIRLAWKNRKKLTVKKIIKGLKLKLNWKNNK